MAPKRKATKTTVAVKTETEETAVVSQNETEQIIETKKSNKKTSGKKNAKAQSEVVNDVNVDISPKKATQRPKRENTKKVVNYVEKSVEEIIEPVKKKSRGKKAPAEAVEANENSENDKHVANNSSHADGNTKKRTKKGAVKDDDVSDADQGIVEGKPKKAKSTKSKVKENEQNVEAPAPRRKPRSKAEQSNETDSAKAQEKPVQKGRKKMAHKPDEVEEVPKKSMKVTKKTIDASPEKKAVNSQKAVKKAEKPKQTTPKSMSGGPRRKQVAGKPQISIEGESPNFGTVLSDDESKGISNEDAIDTSQKISCDEEHNIPLKEEPVVKSRKRAAKVAKPNDAAVTKRIKNEKVATEDKAKPKQKMNSTATDYSKIDFESDKEHTLKICSWNVAGLRALAAKNGLEYFEHEQPDIICLQEIKCTEEEVPAEAKLPGYHMYWCSKPGGRGGVALLTKKMPYNIENEIGDKEMDEEGRIITAEYSKFYLVCVYVPNAGRKLVNLERRLRWNKMFEQHVNKLKATKPVVIVGDMNVAHNEIDLANPKTNTRNAGFTIEERNGMTDLLSHGFVDTFRHLYPERKGAYTFWSYMGGARAKNVGWRLDYGIVSENLASKVVDSIIRSEILGSDHCPILLLLKL